MTMTTRKRIKDEMWVTVPPEVEAKLDQPDAVKHVQGPVIRTLADYLKTQEDDHTEVRLRLADIHVLREPQAVAGVPIYHDCDECRASRVEAEFWLEHNPGRAMVLLLFQYDELTDE
jgi:hypothetical protein